MPHDKEGVQVNVGDLVYVPCRVKAVHLTEDYCNVDLTTVEIMPPSTQPSTFTLNSKQVIKRAPYQKLPGT